MFVATQDDFGAGMWRTRRAPENAFFDGVNVLVNDEGEPFKRGGSALLSNADHGGTLLSVFDAALLPGQRTVALSASRLYALNGSTPVDLVAALGAPVRAVTASGFLVFATSAGPFLYGGSLKTASYSTGTVSTTVDSTAVVGVGTAWSANVDPGMILQVTGDVYGVVETVNSNTSITLRDAASRTVAGATYTLAPGLVLTFSRPGVVPMVTAPSSVASAGSRLVVTKGEFAYFSEPGQPTEFDMATNYHELPGEAQIIGSFGTGNTLLLFTTAGVWSVANLELDALDDFGNVQQQVERIGEIILWGDGGLAAYDEALVVPGIEDVYLMSGGQSQAISEGIRPLYRSYVRAGYQPGVATVHHGHYFLPVLNGTTLVDVLVCRLDRGFAWTRWNAHAAGVAYAERIGSTSRSPKLYGVSAQRVTDLTDCFTPSDTNRMDAIGPAPAFSLTTRDFDTGPGVKGGLLRHARLEYDLVAPSALAAVTVASAAGAEGAAFTAHPDTAPEADGGVKTWMLNRFGERVRLKFDNSDATADMRLRRLELHMQDSQRP